MKTHERLQNHLNSYAQKYPDAWKQFDDLRQGRGDDLPAWPQWCWCPLASAYAVIGAHIKQNRLPVEYVADVGPLGALAAWRMSRGVFRFDIDFYEALWDTPIDGELPIDILFRLPEWCVYIEVPEGQDCRWFNDRVLGWFVHLEWDVQEKRPELRFVFDMESGRLFAFPLHLDYSQLQECVFAALDMSYANMPVKELDSSLATQVFAEQISPFLSVLLYLCADTPDITDLHGRKEKPENPLPAKTKRGLKVFAAGSNTSWQVGFRIGAALRGIHDRETNSENTEPSGRLHTSPKRHIRRAHWHSYWMGPRKGPRQIVLKWLPPIPIGTGDLVTTIHLVKDN